jgi:glycosyltransferase involved in cell wall biosynthesis
MIVKNVIEQMKLAFKYRRNGDLKEAVKLLEAVKVNSDALEDRLSFFINLYKRELDLSDETLVSSHNNVMVTVSNQKKVVEIPKEDIEDIKSRIKKSITKRDYEICFWLAAEYFRKYYSDSASLDIAETVYEFLLKHSAKMSKKFYEDYLYAARCLSSIYLEAGNIKAQKELTVVDSFSINLPTQATNGNDILANHLATTNNPCFTQEVSLNNLVIWGDKISISEKEYWNNLFSPYKTYISIIFLDTDKTKKSDKFPQLHNYSAGSLLDSLDTLKKNKNIFGKVALIHSGLRLSPSLLKYFLYFKPEYNFVITPTFNDITKNDSELSMFIQEVNKKLDNNIQSNFHNRSSLLCCSFDIDTIHRVTALDSIHHLVYASTEFFWRLENRGAYFIKPQHGFAEINATVEKATRSLFKYSHSSKKILNELYPLSQERKRNQKYKVPLIDIYIPMYNAEKYIASAIESCLNQTIKDIRICISNDGSTDNCVNIVKEFQKNHDNILLESHTNAGISITTMKAIALGDGLVIAQLDSDDTLKPEACETLIDELVKDEKMGCVYGSCERIDAAGNFTQKEYSFPEFSRHKMLAVSICHHFRMWKRKYYDRTSHFNPFIVNGIDYDFFSKLSEITNVKHIDKILYQRRWHGENTSIRRESDQTRNTYICMLNSLNRQGLNNTFPVSPFPEEPRKIKFAVQNKKTEILIFPDYSYSNPYQKLLYKNLKNTFDIYKGDLDLAIERVENNSVFFHLHWLNFILNQAESENHAATLVDDFLLKIKLFKDKGGKLVWTIHNNLEHDNKFVAQDLRLRAALCALSDKIHLHDSDTIDEVFKCNPVTQEKLIIHAHGNYIGSYGDFDMNMRTDRISNGSNSVLFIGQLRMYKGLERILKITSLLLKQGLKVTIAGQPENKEVKNQIEKHFSIEKNITLELKRIPDSDLHSLLLNHEFGLLSYDNILTSGSLRLFQSYGITPIAPDLPLFKREIIDGTSGFIYKNSLADLNKMVTSITKTNENTLLQSAQHNFRLAQELDWTGNLISYFESNLN